MTLFMVYYAFTFSGLMNKENKGILDWKESNYSLEKALATVGSDENKAKEREIAAKAVTVVKNENNISDKADKLEGKKISNPFVYFFILQRQSGVLYLHNINNNEKWRESEIVSQ